MTEAILAAFEQTDVDPCEEELTLFNQIETDAVDTLFRNPQDDLQVTTRLWGHVAVLTTEHVILYAET